MAVPTLTSDVQPNLVHNITGTDVDAGNNDYVLGYNQANLEKGFSVFTGTLTNMTITILARNLNGTLRDITSELFGVSALASDSDYICDINLPVKGVVIRAARSNATNAINLTIFAPKR